MKPLSSSPEPDALISWSIANLPASALVEADPEHKPALRAKGLMTRDSRSVERKKAGQPKARKKTQFSKR